MRDFRALSPISERQVKNMFGGYNAALEAAGFEPRMERVRRGPKDPALAQYERQLLGYDVTRAWVQKYQEEILPGVGKYERELPPSGAFTMMIRSDDHAQWCDPFADYLFWDTARRIQPEIIVFDGDTCDFWEVSAHDKNPRRSMTLQSEINYVREHFFRKAREVCPNAQIDWLLGNHEWRLFRYLCTQAPGLASLDCLQFPKLFGLDEFGINLVARPTFLTPRPTDRENYKIYGKNAFVVTHGISCTRTHAFAELDRYGISGASGHVHHFQVQTRKDLNGDKHWVSMPAMCQLKSGEEYIRDLIRWNQGFLIEHIDGAHAQPEPVLIAGPSAVSAGVRYRRVRPALALDAPEEGENP